MAKAKPAVDVVVDSALTPEQQQVATSLAELNDAAAVLADAQSVYTEVANRHRALLKGFETVPDPMKHIFLQSEGGDLSLMGHSEAANHPWRLTVNGRQYDHCAEGENGVWIYR